MTWLVLLLSASALANNAGKTGVSTTGCGTCHGSSADSTTTVTFAADDTTVIPGETVAVTLSVATTSSTRNAGGLDVSATGGSLAAGSNTQLSSSEITHTSRTSMSSGTVTFNFSWTAPATEGTYSLRGAGNAVNSNSASSGDGWNLATDLSFTVDNDCVDDDLDGHEGCAGDCDDSDADVNPDEVEVCNGVDDDCDGDIDGGAVDASTWYRDSDRDGYGDPATATVDCSAPGATWTTIAEDCDDADATAFPGGTEVCGGGDEDCDGSVDEADAADASTWYEDYDGDGYGDPDYLTVACTAPSGWVAVATDCDDTDADVNPAAEEQCDAADVDEDCDGLADDEDDSPVGPTTWYADVDGDSFGDDEESVEACDAPEGWIAVPGDCDDGDAATNPAAVEDCVSSADLNCDGALGLGDGDGDGWAACDECDDGDALVNPDATELCNLVDDDCDGTVDEADAADAATWYADADGDGHGDPAASITACTLPEGYVDLADDCDDADPDAYPGAREIWYDDVDQACDGGSDHDQDGDGVDASASGGEDCDDLDPGVNPSAPETWYDGVDQDCDGNDDDQDGDGVPVTDDCDDLDPGVNPSAPETWYDGVDQDCDGNDDDQDGDGVPVADDCDDLDPEVAASCDTALDSGTTRDTGEPAEEDGKDDPDPSCGCAAGGGGGPATGLVLGVLLSRFGRRRSVRSHVDSPERVT